MRIQAKNLKVMLTAAMLVIQFGCTNPNGYRAGQYLSPYGAVQSQDVDHTVAGNAFVSQNPAAGTNPWVNGLSQLVAPNSNANANLLTNANANANLLANANANNTILPAKSQATQQVATNVVATQKKAASQLVSWDEVNAWSDNCTALGGDIEITESNPDTDGDGIPDSCETLLSNKDKLTDAIQTKHNADVAAAIDKTQFKNYDPKAELKKYYMPGLDPKVFNGALVSTKVFESEANSWFFNKTDNRCEHADYGWNNTLCLIDDKLGPDGTVSHESDAWKSFKDEGGFGDGLDRLDKLVVAKFGARDVINKKDDLAAMRDLFSIEQKQVIKNKPTFVSYYNADPTMDATAIGLTGITSGKYAAVRGGYRQAFPFAFNSEGSLDTSGNSLAELTGIKQDFMSMRKNSGFIYAAETNLIVPQTGMDVQIGQLARIAEDGKSSDYQLTSVGKPAGIFMIIADQNLAIVETKMITNNGGVFSRTKKGLTPPIGCNSVHVVFVYLADDSTKNDMTNSPTPIFSENLFYRLNTGDSWKPIPQERMSLKPIGPKCNIDDKKILFTEAGSVLKTAQ